MAPVNDGKVWTITDIVQLRAMAANCKSIEEIAASLGRTTGAIAYQAWLHGISFCPPPTINPWY